MASNLELNLNPSREIKGTIYNWILFHLLFLMEKSILYAKIAVS